MILKYSKKLTGKERTLDANRMLGLILAFVAGAINAGGFLAVAQYTSHMTGILSSMSDSIALGIYSTALSGLGALASFMLGAASSAILVNFARRRRMHGEYSFPLLFEAVLLLLFGFVGSRLTTVDGLFVSVTVMLLSFMMGLQNAVITKLSKADIRTTHMTGVVTDLGIELGKLFYRNRMSETNQPRVLASRERLRVFTFLILSFFVGGIVGAVGFKHVGYGATVPLALLLVVLTVKPTIDDLKLQFQRNRA